jgi:hypothetical protein
MESTFISSGGDGDGNHYAEDDLLSYTLSSEYNNGVGGCAKQPA